ncbi:hypothetical protein [Brevundimonas sp. SPF441]|uniref:hypothetical protein n=1 Tax=Brevundimonas sp. SPF441 TaxID=2663795 RepID=UPI00129EEB75|nr:hypothetical protein [Brevundimonas sp. SPF441]MRL69137.1 hypothetical protein [Brevundimonas sp. SPF441]
MSSKITVERILRDADDASGQTIREWKLELEGKTLTISGSRHRPDSWIIIRLSDADEFIADIKGLMSVHYAGEIK